MRMYHLDEQRLKTHQGRHSIESLGASTCRKCWGPDGCKQKTIERIAEIVGVRWWELLIESERREFEKLEPPGGTSSSPLCLSHRDDPVRERFFIEALKSEQDVVYLSVMSRHSFQVLDEHLAGKTRFNVLTWMPDTAAEIVGYSKHLNERNEKNEIDDKLEQTANALLEWDKRIDPSSALYRENVRVWTYDSSPTLQGIVVKNGWALIELLTYDTKTPFRPGLLLRNHEKAEHRAFDFFWDRFRALWAVSKKRRIGELPEWASFLVRKPAANSDQGSTAQSA